jgi:putative nucleotidyltransferase with HDIG domain
LWADRLPLLAQMAATEQNPRWHAEGDVLRHTQMVCDILVADRRWQQLPADERELLWRAAVLHDCGKPATTRWVDDRWRSPGHARVGAQIARRLLWQAGLSWQQREQICALIRWHMTPYYLLERDSAQRDAISISLTCRPHHLLLLVSCDARGRIAPDVDGIAHTVDLAGELMEEFGCFDHPYPFASDHARFVYFQRDGRDPAYAAFDDTRSQLTLLSGLPGAGKDTWVAVNEPDTPVVSLDDIRREHGARRSDKSAQGRVLADARERLKTHLRAGDDVIWNTTGLSSQLRAPIIGLAHDYHARVNIVCLERSPQTIAEQNRSRAAKVPEQAYEKMLHSWDFPQLTECHTRLVVE